MAKMDSRYQRGSALFEPSPVVPELFIPQGDYTMPLLQKLKKADHFANYHSCHVINIPWNVDVSCKEAGREVCIQKKAQPGPE